MDVTVCPDISNAQLSMYIIITTHSYDSKNCCQNYKLEDILVQCLLKLLTQKNIVKHTIGAYLTIEANIFFSQMHASHRDYTKLSD